MNSTIKIPHPARLPINHVGKAKAIGVTASVGSLVLLLLLMGLAVGCLFWLDEKDKSFLWPFLVVLLAVPALAVTRRYVIAGGGMHRTGLQLVVLWVAKSLFPGLGEHLTKDKQRESRFKKTCSQCSAYLEFLERREVSHSPARSLEQRVEQLIEEKKLSLDSDDYDERSADVCIALGEEAVCAAFPALSGNLAYSFSLFSFALFLPSLPMRPSVFRRVAEDPQAVRATLAYLYLEEKRVAGEGETPDSVSIRRLIEQCNSEIDKHDQTDVDRHLGTIRECLAREEWPDDKRAVIRDDIRKLEKDPEKREIHQKTQDVLIAKPFLRESLARIFRRLPPETVEGYLDARELHGYIITFAAERGPLSELLDFLSSRDEERRQQLQELQIDNTNYNFVHYTRNARVGVIPKGWSFDQFWNSFENDFRKLLDAKKPLVPDQSDLKHYQVIVHRLGPTRRNYHGLVDPPVKPDAIETLKALLGTALENEELMVAADLSNVNLPEAIMRGSILELTPDLSLPNEVEQYLEEQDEQLRAEILRIFSVKTVDALGHYLSDLAHDKQDTDQMDDFFAQHVPNLNKNQSRHIAEQYIDTLRAVASIM